MYLVLLRLLWIVTAFLTLMTSQGLAEQTITASPKQVVSAPPTGEMPTGFVDGEETQLPRWLDNLLSAERPRLRTEETQELQAELESGLPPSVSGDIPAPETTRQGPQRLGETPEGTFLPPPPIPPLYTSPRIEGEGIWTAEGLPHSSDGTPLLYKCVYRPSEEFPNAIVYMVVFNVNRVRTRFFLGQSEPGIEMINRPPEREDLSKIVAITNAMWMQQHARGAGAIFRGEVIYPMVPQMATLVVYQDDSVDILEWCDDIPLYLVKDARQLRHLIVKDGAVVEKVLKNGKVTDAEIGLGGFLIDDSGRSTMANKYWFLANRTAFGIREDGNLVFAMGHHISTKDLAKALVLAGCKRAIHGDANKHNIVCNFYFRDERNRIVKRDKLSPEQMQYTINRYDQGYTKDFFAFYEK